MCSDVSEKITERSDPRERATEINVPQREMMFIRDNLVAAESARRRGDTATVYKAYNRHASYNKTQTVALLLLTIHKLG